MFQVSAEVSIIDLDPTRWQEYRELSLYALQTNSEAFGSVYEDECYFPDEYWQKHLIEAQQGKRYLLFAQENGKLIGMVTAMVTSTETYLRHSARINRLFVVSDARGKKIGKLIMQNLFSRLRQNNEITYLFLYVMEHQKEAIRLYEQLGFMRNGVFPKLFKKDNDYFDAYLMTCSIEKILN